MSAATAHTARCDDHARATALEACETYAAPDTLPRRPSARSTCPPARGAVQDCGLNGRTLLAAMTTRTQPTLAVCAP